MRVDILTLFPEIFREYLKVGMVGRARQTGQLEVRFTDLRAFTEDRHRSVDERPYGGGPGMLIKPEPVFRALDLLLGADELERCRNEDEAAQTELILLCPQGERLRQPHLAEAATKDRLVLMCGRYEGFDERIVEAFPWRRISVGDFVLSGGEIPAMLLIEGVARLIPGVLGHEESAKRDSFNEWPGAEGYDHPHYTRPAEYRGREVPEILLSGDHGRIENWRRQQARRSQPTEPDTGLAD